MNVLERKRGITLIGLVVTIITILILAGVSINSIIGKNGIVERAQTTGKIQTVASIKEALELEKGDLLVNSKTVNLNNYLDQISNGDKKYEISSKEIIDDKNAEIIVDDKYKFALKDTEEGDVEVTYQGVAASSDLSISAKSGTYVYPTSGTFTVTNNVSGGELTVSSDATNIATATIEGNTVTVVPGTTAGKANIIVKSSANGDYAENKVVHVATVQNGTIELSVTPYTGIYDGKAHDAITKINVNPTDAKIEYSIDGENYSETVPTITETSSFTVTVRASKAGYKTQITTETVKVNKAEGKLTLSATSGTLTYPTSGMFTVSGNTGTLSVASSNTNIATASINGSTVTVKPGTTAGKATITVTSAEASNYNEKSATYEATVQNGTISLSATPYTGTYDGKVHNAFTSVNVTPSDAKLEYSINGGTYSTTMPTITNTSSFTVTVKASKAGYKTQIKTETVRVNKAAGTLTLSATSGTYTYPTSGTFTVSGNTGTLSVVSNNTNIATASISGNTVTVKPGTTAGKVTITVTSAEASNYNEKSATYEATVQNGTISLSATPYTGTYDGKVHNAFTSVNVTPSDAKLEYSINGGTYSTTMPTITNTSSFTVTVKASKAGYKTQIKTETVRVNKAAGTLTLSATSGTYTYPTSGTFTVSGNTGTLSVVSNNTNIATVSVSGNTVTVKPGTTAGKATITVTSAATTNYNEKSATYTATVNNGTISLSATPYTGTYDGKAHNAITKVTVTPSDAKIEYSTNGTTYSTTMPTITNTSSFTVTVRASKAGYKTQSTTQTVKVNKAAGTITLSATSGTIMYPSTSTTFTVSGNTGTLSVSSSNTSVATVSINGNTVTVKSGSTVGTATITVKSAASTNYNEKTATYTVTISNGYVNANTKKTYSDGDVWLPEGFRISKDSASTVKGGIVIEDKDLNQFVWVPVATIADYKRTWYTGWGPFSEYSEALPEDEKTSVERYKGFYIGRYEAGDKESTEAKTLRSSNDVTKTVTIKANQAPYNYVTRKQAVSLAEGFATKQGYKAKTKLVSSYAWDTTIAFMQKVNSDYGSSSEEGNYIDTTFPYTDITGASKTKANDSRVLVPTGQTTPVCNIYDMGGNVFEWTTESCSLSDGPYAIRGGNYGNNFANLPAGIRHCDSDFAYDDNGFRLTLFM